MVTDDRENAGGVIEALRARDDVALAARRLAAGDFLVEDNFAVERKTLADFAASVIGGRLFKQATALAQGARRSVLILEGAASRPEAGGVSRESPAGRVDHGQRFLRLGGAARP